MKLCSPLSARASQTGVSLQLDVIIKTQKGGKFAVSLIAKYNLGWDTRVGDSFFLLVKFIILFVSYQK
jgi:hypothetical protein